MALIRKPTEKELKNADEAVAYLIAKNEEVQANPKATADMKKDWGDSTKRAIDSRKQLDGPVENK